MIKRQMYILIFLLLISLTPGCANKEIIYKPYPVIEDPNVVYSCHNENDLIEQVYLDFWDEHIATPRNMDVLVENLRILKLERDNLYSIVQCYQTKKEEATVIYEENRNIEKK